MTLVTDVLQLIGVTRLFDAKRAVDRLDLTVRRGEFFTLLGPSGCGKTTTLRMVAGLEPLDEGQIILRGRVAASAAERRFDPPDKRNLGMVFQSYAIWPHMTVFENVAYPLEVRGQKRALIRRRVTDVLDLVGLAGLEDRPATQLSGGQQQRLALCRALVYEPDMVLLDEPFSNLDAKLREQMRMELKLLHKRLDVTVLFVTHDQVEALSLSDTIAVMNQGRLEQVGPPRLLYEQPRSAFVRDFLGQNLLLPGRVRERLDNGQYLISLDGMSRDTTVVGRAWGGFAPGRGQPVRAAVRPEDVDLVTLDASVGEQNVVTAIARTALFLGDRYQLNVALQNGAELLLQVPRSRSLSGNGQVHLHLPPEAVTLWPR
jgi:ABC-type Fe3+/spermidine/putrescine transport system ATPase subunit